MSLGGTIRALRLGWYRAPPINAWVRISDAPGNRFVIRLAPLDQIPPKVGRRDATYRCIGPGRGASVVSNDILRSLRKATGITRVKAPVQIVVDYHGNVLQGP